MFHEGLEMPKKRDFQVLVLPGDGIGPEVVKEGCKVLEAVVDRFGQHFELAEDTIGGAAIDRWGVAIRDETVQRAKQSDAVLFGAVGGPRWDDPKATVRPEQAVLRLRKDLGLFANLRPTRAFAPLLGGSSLKREVVESVDFIFIRELTGGTYFAPPKKVWETKQGRRAVDTCFYTEREIARVVRVGLELARGRKKVLHSLDKANVLATSRLWRQVAEEVARDYPDVTLVHMLADAAAMHLIRRPADFDVIVADNLFGDLLTDEASMLAGSLGLMPSASLGRGTLGLYEPIHGSAPDIAGQGKANPLATILSVALMLRHSFKLEEAAQAVERAVEDVLARGLRTADLATASERALSTSEMGDAVAEAVRA
jgi:3-isopropylmalate dehydrogenase